MKGKIKDPLDKKMDSDLPHLSLPLWQHQKQIKSREKKSIH